MAKGLNSWTAQESGAPVTSAEIKTATSDTAVAFSSTTRAMMGVVVPTNTHDMTLNLAGGGSIVIPGASVAAIFAPGGIVPFACDSFSFASTETGFKVIGLF
tara:strand:+ start:44 stop:349 length:306 start_codon:yes stop_codon:yes gene_type:complete